MDLLVVHVNIMISWVYGFMDLSNYNNIYIYIYVYMYIKFAPLLHRCVEQMHGCVEQMHNILSKYTIIESSDEQGFP